MGKPSRLRKPCGSFNAPARRVYADTELLDSICVGGGNDMGIDGIAVKVNGLFVSSQQMPKTSGQFKRAQVEFIFIQSKLSPKFDMGEFGKFAAGLGTFFLSQTQPMNSKISAALCIKNYALLGFRWAGVTGRGRRSGSRWHF